MTMMYTLAQLKRLERLLLERAQEEAPKPQPHPAPWEDGLTAATLIRETAIRGYLCWWLSEQPSHEQSAELDTWRDARRAAAQWAWQTVFLLWSMREQADAVGRPDHDIRDTLRPPAEWKGPDQVVRNMAVVVENLESVGPDLFTWAAASGVVMNDITDTAALQLAKDLSDAVLLALAGTAGPRGQEGLPQPQARQAGRAARGPPLRREALAVVRLPLRGMPPVAHRPQGRWSP